MACGREEKPKPAKTITASKQPANATSEIDSTLLEPHTTSIEGYKIVYGYKAYNEDKYGFQNPGYMRVFKGETLVYEDSFKGEGPVMVTSQGYHNLSGQKLLFALNYGTEACDYTNTIKYYVVIDGKVQFLKAFDAITGGDGYSSISYNTIFPTDSAGKVDAILVVEQHFFHEHDQPDLFDTNYITFTGDKFSINKPTNNLAKAK
jgi:hypothetical protein